MPPPKSLSCSRRVKEDPGKGGRVCLAVLGPRSGRVYMVPGKAWEEGGGRGYPDPVLPDPPAPWGERERALGMLLPRALAPQTIKDRSKEA